MNKGVKIFILSVLSGVLYRLGGMGGAWWKNTKMRDIGVALTALIAMLAMGANLTWALALSTLLLFGSLTTYWKKLNFLFGDTDEDCHWYNWLIHGLVCALAYLPYAIATGCWVWFIARALILSTSMMFWSEAVSNANYEEFGRGFLIVITLPILFI